MEQFSELLLMALMLLAGIPSTAVLTVEYLMIFAFVKEIFDGELFQ